MKNNLNYNFLKNKSNQLGFIFLIVISFISYQLRISIPINAAINSPHDDLLAVRIAKNLILGLALGDWNVNTFAKPSGFYFYLFLLNKFKLDYIVANHLIYLFLSLILSLKICEILFSKKTAKNYYLIIYTYLIFVPTVYQMAFSKVYRSTLSYLLVTAFIILVIHTWSILLKNDVLKNRNEIYLKWLNLSFTSLLFGLTYAALILTRSESYWILIALITFVVTLVFFTENKSKLIYSMVIVIVLSSVSFFVSINTAKKLSFSLYGYSLTENFYSNNFANAINLWSSIEIENDDLYHVTVNKAKREIVYAISPTASKLKPFLETEPDTGWKIQSCMRNKICDESSSWFPWELRDAAAQAVVMNSENDFQVFFKNIYLEIKEGCEKKIIQCGRTGAGPGSRSILDLPKSELFNNALNGFENLFIYPSGANMEIPDTAPGVTEEIVREYHEVVKYKTLNQNKRFNSPKISEILSFQVRIFSILNIFIIILSMSLLLKLKYLKKYIPIIIYLSVAILINLVGLAVFEISLGFTPGLDLYLLTVYPVFHVTIAILLGALLHYFHSHKYRKST